MAFDFQSAMAGLSAQIAETFGMNVTLTRRNSGGSYNHATGTESGGSTLSCTVRANRIRRGIVVLGDPAGGGTKVEECVYEITLAELAAPTAGTWGGGDPRSGDSITEASNSAGPGDAKVRVISSSHRLPTLPIVQIVTRTPAVVGG